MIQRGSIVNLLILLLVLLGGVIIYFITPFGIGTSPDSVVYIAAANNFLGGHGLTTSSAPDLYVATNSVSALLSRSPGSWRLDFGHTLSSCPRIGWFNFWHQHFSGWIDPAGFSPVVSMACIYWHRAHACCSYHAWHPRHGVV